MNRLATLKIELEVLVKELARCIELLPKMEFEYSKGISLIGPDSFNCYLGCTFNEKIKGLRNEIALIESCIEYNETCIFID